jgi:hypothetical protein
LLIVTVSLWFCRHIILQAAAAPLVVDQSPADCAYILVLNGDYWSARWFDEAADLYREDPSRRILLVESRPERAVRLGVLPSYAERSRRVLAARGVPREAVVVIPGEAPDVWAEVELLRQWLSERPDADVRALSDRFSSRAQRVVLDRVLPAEDAARVTVCALPDIRCNEHNWWQSRWGAKAFLYGWLKLAYACCGEAETDPAPTWNPDEYERTLDRAAAGANP